LCESQKSVAWLLACKPGRKPYRKTEQSNIASKMSIWIHTLNVCLVWNDDSRSLGEIPEAIDEEVHLGVLYTRISHRGNGYRRKHHKCFNINPWRNHNTPLSRNMLVSQRNSPWQRHLHPIRSVGVFVVVEHTLAVAGMGTLRLTRILQILVP